MMLCFRRLSCCSSLKNIYKSSASFYSKRSDSKASNSYKVVKSDQRIRDDDEFASLGVSPNWELLAPSSYRFFLPGSVGPAWHDITTVAQAAKTSLKKQTAVTNASKSSTFKCIIQDCPVLLRKGVLELFSGSEIGESELSIITLEYESSGKLVPEGDEAIAKSFVLAAEDICNKLRAAGFWADFINPFSGRPYLSPYHGVSLYETHEKFRCLGFQIEERANCKLIMNEDEKNFIGSLFTTAPSSMLLLEDLLK
ncbi:cobalamin trafficking protein CblD [Anabrus simplex]|uniref:cobalamin trafficking protein CblD n=1 Tax=Anabrus simplex TaxID=316456 RepID=UPI0034DD88D9